MQVKTTLVDATELSQLTGIKEEKIRRWTRQGRLSHFRYGYYVKYNMEEAERILQAINNEQKFD
jgi:predicted site-specific integrase-resolvase